jgi:hypothetical protein
MMAAFDFPSSPTVGQIANGYTWDGEKWVLPEFGGTPLVSKATIAFCFDTYRSAYDNAALTFMTDLGFVGTFFMVPESIDTGGQLSSDELAILFAKAWEIGAYASSADLSKNLAQMYDTDRKSVLLRFKVIQDLMHAKGMPVHAIAAMQRTTLHPQITEMARPWFKVVRVAGEMEFATYPIVEPLYLIKGGGSNSLSSTDTIASLSATLDACIAVKGLWCPIIHEVGTPASATKVDPSVLSGFMSYCKTKVDAGLLRVTTLSKAMQPA